MAGRLLPKRRKASSPPTPRHDQQDSEDEEPRLPSTPVQLGLEPLPKPPSGLFSGGSARKSGHRSPSTQSSPTKAPYTQPWDGGNRFVNLRSPDNLLIVKLCLKYGNVGNELVEMTALDITDWAEAELGSYLRDLAAAHDLVRMRQVVNEYWRMSEERAECWNACESGVMLSQLPSPSGILQGLPLLNVIALHSQQNLLLCFDGITLVIRWEILPSHIQRLEPRLSACVLVDGEENDVSAELNEADEAFGALIESGQSVTDAIKTLAQIVFDMPAR